MRSCFFMLRNTVAFDSGREVLQLSIVGTLKMTVMTYVINVCSKRF